jgi:hypothetical protein
MGITYGPRGEVLHSDGRPMYYRMDGTAATRAEFIAMVKDPRRFIGNTIIRHRGEVIRVSTVFLMLDHSFMGGPPVLWETMVFGGPNDCEQWRYAHRRAAKAGHRDVVRFLRLALAVDDNARRRRSRMHSAYRRRGAASA